MKKILGLGNALVDALVAVDDEVLAELGLPKGAMQLIDKASRLALEERFAATDTKRATGGSACNTIKALASAGAAAGLVGKVGADEAGRFFRESATKSGIDACLLVDALPTGLCTSLITPDGQRTLATYLGAAANLQPDDLQPAMFEGFGYLYIEGYLVQNHALMLRAVELARRFGMTVCIDLASYNIVEAERDFFAELLRQTDIVFANEEEARAFASAEPEAALETLAGFCPTAVVKVGARGVLAASGAERVALPALPVETVVDTTGAGDYFAAGFLYEHARGASLERCAATGALFASHVIQEVGAELPDACWQAIRARL